LNDVEKSQPSNTAEYWQKIQPCDTNEHFGGWIFSFFRILVDVKWRSVEHLVKVEK
jgi:hypothetical protein